MLRRALPFALAAAAAVAAGGARPAGAAAAPPLPAWDLTGAHDVALPTGFASLDGRYVFGSLTANTTTIEGRSGSFDLSYDANARLSVGGFLDDFTFLTLSGTWSVGTDGAQTVVLAEQAKRPRFTFTGTVGGNGREIRGTYDRSPGFLGLPDAATGRELLLTLDPSVPTPAPSFRLRFGATMDRRGVVKGAPGMDGKETRARLDIFGGRALEGGIVRGRVRTDASDGTTTARVKITGRGWRVVLDGPVDEQGFHAAADVRAAGFVIDDAAVTFDVGPGPEPPPPPPPPDPPNLIAKGTARIVSGQVQIRRENAPTKFFGAGADVNVHFPVSDVGQATFTANASTSGGATPRRFFVELGTRTYGAAGPGGAVTMSIRKDGGGNLIFSTTPGRTIEVVCQGQVADASGRTKTVDVIVRATVVQ